MISESSYQPVAGSIIGSANSRYVPLLFLLTLNEQLALLPSLRRWPYCLRVHLEDWHALGRVKHAGCKVFLHLNPPVYTFQCVFPSVLSRMFQIQVVPRTNTLPQRPWNNNSVLQRQEWYSFDCLFFRLEEDRFQSDSFWISLLPICSLAMIKDSQSQVVLVWQLM